MDFRGSFKYLNFWLSGNSGHLCWHRTYFRSLKMQRNLVNLNIGGACHFLHQSLLNFVSFSYLEYRVTHKKPDGNDGGHKEVLDQIDDYGIKIAPRAISSTIKV